VGEAVAAARRHHGIDLVLGERCVGGETGAYGARLDGEAVVVKWSPSPAIAERWAVAADRVERLRAAGYPAPRYWPPLAFPGGALVVQAAVPGTAHDEHVDLSLLDAVLALNRRQAGLGDPGGWHELMVRSLTEGCDGWCLHEPLGRHSREGARLLDRVREVGRAVPPLPEGDVVHLDFHHRNLLRSGPEVRAVIDWEGAVDGDRHLDLVTFAFGLVSAAPGPTLAATEAALWDHLTATIPPDHLRVYAAHMALRLADWRVRHHSPADADAAVTYATTRLTRVW
jgi:hypothetical protein